MTDENENEEHNHPPNGFAFQIAGPPPEVIEQQRMAAEANSHETRQFFDSLNEAQLRKFLGMMQMAVMSDGQAANYFMGVAAGWLDLKLNICLACGKNHSEIPAEWTDSVVDAPQHYAVRNCCGTEVGKPHDEQCRLMVEYNVEPNEDGDEMVACKGCGQWYPNLEDRMLRRADKVGCPGCVQKEKWG